jgi:hypothetical protein
MARSRAIERGPTRVVGLLEVDPREADHGTMKEVELDDVAVEVVRVPAGVQDLDRVPVGPEQVAVVNIVPRRRFVLRLLVFLAIVIGLFVLLFLLSL